LVGLLKTTDGVQSVTVHLRPPELGQVQIRVDRTMEGAAHVDITAERPETLALLKRDEPALQQTLDQAGILSNGRSVSFQVATPEQIVASTPRTDHMATDSGSSGQQQSDGAWRQNADAQHDPGDGPGSEQRQARARWFRAGLDITA
jgi:flagellar hook-length control protein FliK